MQVLPTYITVRSDDILERAIASEVSADEELTEDHLQKIVAQYKEEKEIEKEE